MSTTIPKRQSFPPRLREAIDRKAISISELARRISEPNQDVDATRRSIHKHLNGEAKPRRDVRRKYEKALDLEMGDLDDSEADMQSMTVDEFLRLRIAELTQSNEEAARPSRERDLLATEGVYAHGNRSD